MLVHGLTRHCIGSPLQYELVSDTLPRKTNIGSPLQYELVSKDVSPWTNTLWLVAHGYASNWHQQKKGTKKGQLKRADLVCREMLDFN